LTSSDNKDDDAAVQHKHVFTEVTDTLDEATCFHNKHHCENDPEASVSITTKDAYETHRSHDKGQL
jgi:hypothetical protein